MTEEKDEWDQFPPMLLDQAGDFLDHLIRKLAYVLDLKAQGINVGSVESGVLQQIHDTLTNGDPKKT